MHHEESILHFYSLCSGAIYLKNCIFRYWKREESEGEEMYAISEVAKVFIRDNIVGAIIKSPLLIWLVLAHNYSTLYINCTCACIYMYIHKLYILHEVHNLISCTCITSKSIEF